MKPAYKDEVHDKRKVDIEIILSEEAKNSDNFYEDSVASTLLFNNIYEDALIIEEISINVVSYEQEPYSDTIAIEIKPIEFNLKDCLYTDYVESYQLFHRIFDEALSPSEQVQIKIDNQPQREIEENNGNREEREKTFMDGKQKMLDAFIEAIDSLPESREIELLDLVNEFVGNAKYQPIKTLPSNKEEVLANGIELYPDFKKRTGETDGLMCLKENYAPWLKKFTPTLDRDYMCQADLGKLDPKLLSRLRKLFKAEELGSYIPNENELNKQIARTISETEKKELTKKHNIIYRL